MKKALFAILGVFITWSLLDIVLHGFILKPTYEETSQFWRPMEEMKTGLMYAVTLVHAACFVLIYFIFFKDRSLASATLYGLIYGLAAGLSMGFGTYSYMPIPITLAWGWFLGTLVEAIAAGTVLGIILKD